MKDKIASISLIEIIPVRSISKFENTLGQDTLKLLSDIIFPVNASSINFSEKGLNGEMKDIELSFKVSNATFNYNIFNGLPVLISLEYTNNVKKVIGTKDSPCLLDIAQSGTPIAFTISYKGQQPEFSKRLLSF